MIKSNFLTSHQRLVQYSTFPVFAMGCSELFRWRRNHRFHEYSSQYLFSMFTLARRRCIGFCSAQAGFQDISSHLFTILSTWLHGENLQTTCCWCAHVLKGAFYLGQVQLGPILACPFDHPKCQDVKKKKKEKMKKDEKKETKGRDNQYSPCFCEGDAFTQTRLMPAFRVSTGLHVQHRLT